MKKQTKLFFQLNKFSFIELTWTLVSAISDGLVIWHWYSDLFTVPHIIYLVVALIITGFGVYRSYESFSTYPIRLDDYYRICEMFDEGGVKKSLLYHVQDIPCGATIAEQLVKDYDIKDVKLYSDDLKSPFNRFHN